MSQQKLTKIETSTKARELHKMLVEEVEEQALFSYYTNSITKDSDKELISLMKQLATGTSYYISSKYCNCFYYQNYKILTNQFIYFK